MFAQKHIVVLIDPAEESALAVRKASRLARIDKARLTLFASGYNATLASNHPLNPDTADQAKDAYMRRLMEGLETIADIARNDGVEVTTKGVWDKHAGPALMNFIEEEPVDMVVKATHHQNVIQRTFFSQTDWELIRHCPVPLLLTKANAWNDPIRLTAAVDPVQANDKPDTLDEHIVRWGKDFATHLGGRLELLHVYDPTPLLIYLDQPTIDSADISEEIREQHEQALAKLAQDHDIPKDQTVLETGSTLSVIPEHLHQTNTDMVIMGAVARSGLERWLLGHTAEKILDRITVDILIVK
ncbi:universal stress protein [Saccharospirillum salsuginis]|uniref:Universal stress protein E n=1 Tax=Saccharospirillum salsuginis TaxID=418750 RepID=A0A918K2P8_9GAMM|nr:universal stress protein [Saccharospirillum salsuginis]GGX46581.1 universal stress protein E [Saccharospirillum salsuginis]